MTAFKALGNTIKMPISKTVSNTMKNSMGMLQRNKNAINNLASGLQEKCLTSKPNLAIRAVKYLGGEGIKKLKYIAPLSSRVSSNLVRSPGKKSTLMRSASKMSTDGFKPVATKLSSWMSGSELKSMFRSTKLPYLFAAGGLGTMTQFNLVSDEEKATWPTLFYKKLNAAAHAPVKGSESAAGYDLASVEKTVVPAKGQVLVSTGLAVAIPDGNYGRIAPRSGLATTNAIDVGAGVVDEDYRGEVKVLLVNLGNEDFEVNEGDRIAQFIVEKYTPSKLAETEDLAKSHDDEVTARGAAGFGSTGVSSVRRNVPKEGVDKDFFNSREDYPASRSRSGSRGGGMTCFNCNQEGHISRECPEPRKERRSFDRGGGGRAPSRYGERDQSRGPMTCYNCGAEGHMSRECPSGRKCFNCNGLGHESKDCSEPRKERDQSAQKCYQCGEYGHISRDCSQN